MGFKEWWSGEPNENRLSWARTDIDPRLNQRETSTEESANSPSGQQPEQQSSDTRTPQQATSPTEGRESGEETTPAGNGGSSESGTASESAAGQSKSSSATTEVVQSGGSSNSPAKSGTQEPNRAYKKPRPNPLASFSSMSYKIGLHMLTVDAYNAYLKTGTIPTSGVYVVAQSGGINVSSQQRMPGNTFDYYIENLKFESLININASTNTTGITFDVIEPTGFSFLTELANASNKINKGTKPFDQHYLLSIQFLGYDSVGNLLNASSVSTGATMTGAMTNNFQKIFTVKISEAKFDLKGNMTTYNIVAQVVADEPKKVSRSVIKSSGTIDATTVGDALTQLFSAINNYQKGLAESGLVKTPDVYKFEIQEKSIKDATFIDGTPVKTKAGASNVKSPQDSNESASAKNKDTKLTSRQFSFGNETILKRIEQIITVSSYIGDALPIKTTESSESSTEKNSSTKKLNWCSVNTRVKILGWDSKRNDWAYEITYVISKQTRPYINSVYVTKDNAQAYGGPDKRYSYYFTGKNSEILSFSQKYNSLYYITSIATPDGKTDVKPLSDTKQVAAPASAGNQTGGKTGQAAAIASEVVTQLNSPVDKVLSRMTVLGDPDYLDLDVFSHGTVVIEPGKSESMDASSGGVFVEVSFFEGKDYDVNSGTLKVNKSINFANYSPEVAKLVQGTVFQVRAATSSFSHGKFTQELELILVNDLVAPGGSSSDTTRQREGVSATTPTADTSTTNSSSTNNDSRETQTAQETAPTVEERPASDASQSEVKQVSGSGVQQDMVVVTADQVNKATDARDY